MNYKDFKNSIINLGFEESDVFDENEIHLIESINRALIFINTLITPKEKIVHITCLGGEKYEAIDISKFPDFDEISTVPPKIFGKPVSDYYYEENTLYIKAEGDVSITYNAKSELVPYDVEDEYIIDISEALIPVLQYRTAYFMWLDDDERKAVYYLNLSETYFQMYLNTKMKKEKENVTVSCEGGIDLC